MLLLLFLNLILLLLLLLLLLLVQLLLQELGAVRVEGISSRSLVEAVGGGVVHVVHEVFPQGLLVRVLVVGGGGVDLLGQNSIEKNPLIKPLGFGHEIS